MLEEITFESLPEAMQTEVNVMTKRVGGRIAKTAKRPIATGVNSYIVYIACPTSGMIASAMANQDDELLEFVGYTSMSYDSMEIFLEHAKAERASSK